MRGGKTLRVSIYLWPRPAAVYIIGLEAVSCRDHDLKPTWFLSCILTGQEIINLSVKTSKNKMAKGSCAPARQRTGFRRTIHAHVARARPPGPGPIPRPARRASTRVWSSTSLLNTSLSVVERTHYIKRSHTSSTSGVGLNFRATSCYFTHGPL